MWSAQHPSIQHIRLGDSHVLVWSSSSRICFLFPGEVRREREVLAGSFLECCLNLEVFGHIHQARNPHVNLLRTVAISTYVYLYLGESIWGSCPTWFSDGNSLSVGTDFTPLLHTCTVMHDSSGHILRPWTWLSLLTVYTSLSHPRNVDYLGLIQPFWTFGGHFELFSLLFCV